MAIYSLANRTSAVATAAASLEVIAASAMGCRVLEIGLTLNAATASVLSIGRPAAIGVTPTAPVTVLGEDAGNAAAGVTQTALAWGTAPTVPPNFFRRVSLPATIGAGIIWTFPRGIIIPKSGSTAGTNNLVLWNPSAGSNSVTDVWVVVDE
jgi:hypothetical protein